ncbi:BLOC-1-related complex subunit 8 isoform X2 [Perognathus longimembris pacificus]|uniref:BLOC-1-related complex subunit 8 isoform X2 n=1 Tax=Perognathus longimembris pacificus TaxID=214514 RepID=UPI002018EEC6|nr:BLOC-1-related complex subunit 8 isoform X2 [Perognathus longimembris pacificus]
MGITDKFTESVYVLANEPSVALYRLQEHVRRSLPELAQHKSDMQRWEEQSQGAIYTVEYACSAVKNLVDSSIYFRSVEGLLKQAISIRDHMNATSQGHSPEDPAPPPVPALTMPPARPCPPSTDGHMGSHGLRPGQCQACWPPCSQLTGLPHPGRGLASNPRLAWTSPSVFLPASLNLVLATCPVLTPEIPPQGTEEPMVPLLPGATHALLPSIKAYPAQCCRRCQSLPLAVGP